MGQIKDESLLRRLDRKLKREVGVILNYRERIRHSLVRQFQLWSPTWSIVGTPAQRRKVIGFDRMGRGGLLLRKSA
jgi:hypothetical protein